MTMGQAPKELVVGYLRNQRLVISVDEIVSVDVDWEVGAAAVRTRSGISATALERRTVTSGCGQGTMFGELLDGLGSGELRRSRPLGRQELLDVLRCMRELDTVYKVAGAVHGCALFTRRGGDVEMLIHVEDIGRHNAVDAIAGWMWLSGISGDDCVFYTTGRLTSEMVIKCVQMGIPFLASRSGATGMGYEIARRTGVTMIARAINARHQILSGIEHFDVAEHGELESVKD